jgi:Secretion system C-terminal sorting domain
MFILFAFNFVTTYAQVYYNFSASAGTFTNLSGGTAPPLTAAYAPSKTVEDESYANKIPLGFTFAYNGKNYDSIHLNSNGFASLGSPFAGSASVDPAYHRNELRAASGLKGAIRPILAPFWDDLILTNVSNLRYLTTNAAPNRVFTAEWRDMIWRSGAAAISFQLKIYESTNIIEFVYRDEAGAGGSNKSASIGITTANNQTTLFEIDSIHFLSLTSPAATAVADKIQETDNIAAEPASGQVFRFTPKACTPPTDVSLSGYGPHSATIKWGLLAGVSDYQFALSNIEVAPVVATTGAASFAKFNGLIPNTDYYFYVRSNCGGPWEKFNFKTAATVELPYAEDFESALEVALPAAMTAQNISNEFADALWQTTDLLPAASGTRAAVNSAQFVPAHSVLYTPAVQLIGGVSYSLSYKVSVTGGAHALEVKCGRKAGLDSLDISLDNSTLTNTAYETKLINFVPESSGYHQVGFVYKSAVDDDLLLLDDVAIGFGSPLPVEMVSFKASLTNDRQVNLKWETTNEVNASHFIVERSRNGTHFKEIGTVRSTAAGQTINRYVLLDPKPARGHNYYRLKQVDKNRAYQYSQIELVNLAEHLVSALYPNPSGNEVFLQTNAAEAATIKVFALDGREMGVSITLTGEQEMRLLPNERLVPGIYLVTIQTENSTNILKWTVQQ